jgi:hypothetical protein
MRKDPRERAAAAAAAVAASVAIFFLPILARGLSLYWGDLTYLHWAWRAAPAQLVQSGRAPLWEPSLYLGMPMAASMQGGLFYPPSILFFLFGFATATAAYQALHAFLAAWLTALWLRSLRLGWGASVGAGLSFAFGGLMMSRLPFLNHLSVLAWAPALALLFRKPGLLGPVLALMFLAGYPTFIPGLALAAWALALILRARRSAGPAAWAGAWAAAVPAALLLSGAQLLPALELAAHSRRAAGVEPAEALIWSFTASDLRQWVSPLLVPLSSFKPEADWWKCVYLGLAAFAAAAYGLARLPRRRAAGVAALLAAVVVLTLGGSNAASTAVWNLLPPLRYVRYPGNLAYLALLPLAALVGAGLSRARGAAPLAAAIAVELFVCGWRATPLAPRGLFVEPGPLVRGLQGHLGATRYLLSPRSLQASSGRDVVDWKTRLYGLTNAPYRLRAVGNFGEPLVPAPSYEFMDALFRRPDAAAAAPWMPWAGASLLLTPAAPAATPLLIPEGRALWFVSRAAADVSTAYWLDPEAGAALPASIPPTAPAPGRPLAVARPREDRLSVSGEGAGWVFLSEPRYPGWRATLSSSSGESAVEPAPALGAFQKFRVPDGQWSLSLRYAPAAWRLGVLASLAALLALGGYWYHRLSRPSHVA